MTKTITSAADGKFDAMMREPHASTMRAAFAYLGKRDPNLSNGLIGISLVINLKLTESIAAALARVPHQGAREIERRRRQRRNPRLDP